MLGNHYPLARLKRAAQRAFIHAGFLRTHDLKLEQFDGSIHVYTDGSYSKKQKRLGYAAVIKLANPDDEVVLHDKHAALRKQNGEIRNEDNQNIAAELKAVIMALDNLPVDSEVILHTDFMEIEAYLNDLITPEEHHKYRRHGELWDQLDESALRHKDIFALRATDNERTKDFENRRLMRIAHNFSVYGSGSANMKEFLTQSDEDKYADFIDGVEYRALKQPHPNAAQTPNALDVIDLSEDDRNMPLDYGIYNNDDPQPD